MSQKEVWASLQAFGQEESEDEECEKAKDDENDTFHQMYTWYTESVGQISEAVFAAGWESSFKNMYVEALEKGQSSTTNMPAFMHIDDQSPAVILWTAEDQTKRTVEEIQAHLAKFGLFLCMSSPSNDETAENGS